MPRNGQKAVWQSSDGAYDLAPTGGAETVDPHDASILWRACDGKLCYKRTEKDWLWYEYPATVGGWIVPSVTVERCRLWIALLAAAADTR